MASIRFPFLLGLLLAPAFAHGDEPATESSRYFAIEVVDEQTGRGVPLVELQGTSGARYYTDSAGLIAFHEPGLMGRRVYFGVSAHGYEFAKDGFGIRGVVLETKPGGAARLTLKRLNVAERLYRITGQGVYRETVLLGRKAPVAEPLLNAEVTGQDSVLTAVYGGKVFWFYGDTARLSYALGNFATSGATTDPPDRLDPNVGINLKYFVGADGFSRPMAPMKGEGVVWLSAVVVLPDASGRERMLAYYQRRQGLGAVLEEGFVEYDDESEQFKKVAAAPKDPWIMPAGHPFRVMKEGADYLYFTAPYPALRVRADRASYLDLAVYEGYTCLKPGTLYGDKDRVELDRDAAGKLVWAWKRGTPPLGPKEQAELVAAGKMTREESPFRLQDVDGGRPFLLHGGSCSWNEYRKKYVMIASEVLGATVLGEVWYSEADAPEGPWADARKIITHANKPGDAHDFYNPTQHPFLDREGGRVIYLEGTYVNTFSGNPHPTPYYEYNQILYRLDLSDPRLKLPRVTAAGSR
ncbi:hypothetical protein EP7_005313 [Isosphaeraceae bacterium EP7]